MNELELDAMVLRLMGDGASYVNMMQNAANVTEKARGSIEAAAGRIIGIGGTLRTFASTAAQALGAMGIGLSLFGSIFKGVNLAAEAEENQVAFEVMLKSAERGKQMLEDLTEFAAKTPLNLPDIQRATKTLLQFGTGGEDIIPTLKMLGDVTGGNAERFNRMAFAFGQMQSTGRLMGQDLNQMINAGFNPLSEIAKTTGKSMGQLKAEMEAGRISVDMVKAAFKSATAAGGTFANQMEKQSKTISGLFSTMQDDIGAFLRTMGKDIVELLKLKEIMQAVSSAAQAATEWLKGLSESTKRIAAVVGTAVAALMAFGLAWEVLGGVIMAAVAPVLTVITSLFSPLGVVILGVAAATTAWVQSVGGLAEAWKIVKDTALAAWDWVQPILTVLGSFFSALKDLGMAAFTALGQFILGVWQQVVGDTQINWETVRNTIMDAILFAEFTLQNFGAVAQATWSWIKLQFGVFVDNFVNGIYVIQANFEGMWAAIAAGAQYLVGNFGTLFTRGLNVLWDKINVGITFFVENFRKGLAAVGTMVKNFATNSFNWIKSIFTSGPGAVKELSNNIALNLQNAQNAMENEGKSLGEFTAEAFRDAFNKSMSGRNLGDSDLTAKWRREFEDQAGELGKSFDQFRQQKMDELFSQEQETKAKDAAKRVGYEAGQAMAQGPKAATQAIKEFDAALKGSAEALARITAFRESTKAKTSTSGSSLGSGGFEAARAGSAEAAARVDKSTPILADIRDLMRQQLNKPGLEVSGAGLA